MSTFALRKLVVYTVCERNKRKVLEPEEFVFTDRKYDSFFEKGVVIHAIVGKNGSGKSSLVEMLFRMSNNLAAVMVRDYDRPAAEQIYYIENVVADLHYSLNGVNGILQCKQESVKLSFDDESFEWSLDTDDCKHIKNRRVITEKPFPTVIQAAAKFFYTLATNYSMQAYVTNDFSSESLLSWNKESHQWERTHAPVSWIDGVFHKNDGYMGPLVLNPYRRAGIIDMAKEEHLTTNRLASILWETRLLSNESQMIEGYRLFDIKYRLDNSLLKKKFDPKYQKGSFGDWFLEACARNASVAKSILDSYGVDLPYDVRWNSYSSSQDSDVVINLLIYLAYKTLSIAKYPSYSHFQPIGDINLIFQSKEERYYHDLVRELVDKIKGDRSHITWKIRQTLRLLRSGASDSMYSALKKGFTYREYVEALKLPDILDSVEDRNLLLPPPVFRGEIFLIKNEDCANREEKDVTEIDNVEIMKEKAISINSLSSGERQLIYMASTMVYHALNLKSVPQKTRVKYQNICMVLDEIEICFHPEYQRTFIQYFIGLIKRMRLNESFGINIMIVTHSPFILSDIPQGNIMYLEKGHQLTKDELTARGVKNPFCANINDILHQSFFLEKGFVGEFAKQKVLSLADYLKEGKHSKEWNSENSKVFIDEVSEPLVREHLLNLYIEKFGTDREKKIAFYQAEIERLKKEER